ncbi:flagellar biosynthesis regulator FlaF [Halocynthiibacter namhaensis]|uniref:flagellar biosynthesis regulator FlaF n=1 Tax=Halocynthiibacter namhaensis TaxID=1290553 RepID=UPI000578E63D|nr:flagellar biosynthesis regulator FlaF [Halocynthiibacter namhaensis]
MNAYHMAKTAYSGTNASTIRTPSANEYEAFADVTRKLMFAAARSPQHIPEIAHAIHDNRQLWSRLASDVVSEDNQLPVDLRARIFSLAEFTTRHSSKVLKGDATLTALIDINTTIMRGLRAQDHVK